MGHLFNKCPICGSRVVMHSYMQFTLDYMIKQNGMSAKTHTKSGICPMEESFFSCISDKCDFATDCDGIYTNKDFSIHVYMAKGGIYMYDINTWRR